jgi:hypothetical protein
LARYIVVDDNKDTFLESLLPDSVWARADDPPGKAQKLPKQVSRS